MSLFLPFLPYFYPIFPPSGGSQIQDAAFGYFITACVVILLSILSYVLLPKLVSVSHTHITNVVTLRLLSRPIEIFWSVKVILFWGVWCFLHLASLLLAECFMLFHLSFVCVFRSFSSFIRTRRPKRSWTRRTLWISWTEVCMLSLSLSLRVSYLKSVWRQIGGAFFSDSECLVLQKVKTKQLSNKTSSTYPWWESSRRSENQQLINKMIRDDLVNQPELMNRCFQLAFTEGKTNQSKEPVAVPQL